MYSANRSANGAAYPPGSPAPSASASGITLDVHSSPLIQGGFAAFRGARLRSPSVAAIFVLSLLTLLGTACGGGGGGGSPPLSYLILGPNSGADDGFIRSNLTFATSSVYGIAVGDNGSGVIIDGYLRVPHDSGLLVAAPRIVSVTLHLTKVRTIGPLLESGYAPIHLNHVDYGALIDGFDFAPVPLPGGADFAQVLWAANAGIEHLQIDVTAQVIADLAANRGHTDFYLYASGARTFGYWMELEDFEGEVAAESGPYLLVAYTP